MGFGDEEAVSGMRASRYSCFGGGLRAGIRISSNGTHTCLQGMRGSIAKKEAMKQLRSTTARDNSVSPKRDEHPECSCVNFAFVYMSAQHTQLSFLQS